MASRMKAALYNLTRFNGKPCVRCKSDIRYTKSGRCVNCYADSQRAYRKARKQPTAEQLMIQHIHSAAAIAQELQHMPRSQVIQLFGEIMQAYSLQGDSK